MKELSSSEEGTYMTTGTKKVLGAILMVLGAIFIIGTPGRVDWEIFSFPAVPKEDMMPLWQILLQAGGGFIVFLLGYRLRRKAVRHEKMHEKMIATINWSPPTR